ncbi:hypothetical protein ACFWHT_12045 [Microbacterium sp. NPDC058342]|uniref:hypothetical protein n=1 Tax=Microbacterium sp. NPDC058342 TaxID=3346454 RepID=UPI00364AA7E6
MPRHSAAVYRRRRLAVVLLLIVSIAAIAGGVWLAVAQPWSAPAPAPAPSSTQQAPAPTGSAPAPTAGADSPAPDPSETPGLVACEAGDVEVKAVTDAESYAAGALPKLSITLTSRSTEDCTMNVGSSTQRFTVTSGKDVWWRSTDCQSDPSDMIVTLKAGTTVSSADPVVWDRTRSSVDTCEQKNRPRAPGGGASYHVSVAIGGFESETSRQIFLR